MMAAPGNKTSKDWYIFDRGDRNRYIQNKNGICEVFPAPLQCFLTMMTKTYVEPDISVICDKSKLDDRGL